MLANTSCHSQTRSVCLQTWWVDVILAVPPQRAPIATGSHATEYCIATWGHLSCLTRSQLASIPLSCTRDRAFVCSHMMVIVNEMLSWPLSHDDKTSRSSRATTTTYSEPRSENDWQGRCSQVAMQHSVAWQPVAMGAGWGTAYISSTPVSWPRDVRCL